MTKDINPQILKTLREIFQFKSKTLVDSLKILQKYTPCHTLSMKAVKDLIIIYVVLKNSTIS